MFIKNVGNPVKIKDLLLNVAQINKPQYSGITGNHSIINRHKVILNSRNKAAQIIWILKLLGFEPSFINNSKIKINNDKLNPGNRVPIKPLIKLIERNNLVHEIRSSFPEVYDLLYNENAEFITRDDAEKIIDLLRKHIRILNSYDRELLIRLALLINSDIAIVRVVDVERIPYSGFVYDISVPDTELFLGGEYPIALHNTGIPYFQHFMQQI